VIWYSLDVLSELAKNGKAMPPKHITKFTSENAGYPLSNFVFTRFNINVRMPIDIKNCESK
jgi:hypothetical protein